MSLLITDSQEAEKALCSHRIALAFLGIYPQGTAQRSQHSREGTSDQQSNSSQKIEHNEVIFKCEALPSFYFTYFV